MPEARSWPHASALGSRLVESFIHNFSRPVPFRPGHRPRRRTHQGKSRWGGGAWMGARGVTVRSSATPQEPS